MILELNNRENNKEKKLIKQSESFTNFIHLTLHIKNSFKLKEPKSNMSTKENQENHQEEKANKFLSTSLIKKTIKGKYYCALINKNYSNFVLI